MLLSSISLLTISAHVYVDLDLDKDDVMGAYTEVSREFNIAKATEYSFYYIKHQAMYKHFFNQPNGNRSS